MIKLSLLRSCGACSGCLSGATSCNGALGGGAHAGTSGGAGSNATSSAGQGGTLGGFDAAIAHDGGVRRFVIGTTDWAEDRPAVESLLLERGAAAVASPSFSLGVMLFARLVEDAARLFGPFADYDPYLVEWHRRTKADRPSGTAIELSRRLIAAHPRKTRVARPMAFGAPTPEELDVSVIRAGAAPGMHLVGFDAPGESLEMRLTARDRSAYAAGAFRSRRAFMALAAAV